MKIEVQRGANRVCFEAGRGRHDDRRGVSQSRDQRRDILCVAQEVRRADAIIDEGRHAGLLSARHADR